MTEFWQHLSKTQLQAGAQILIGPGAPEGDLPPLTGIERRHVPAETLIPLAEGARLAGPDRPVIAVGGDGDLYGPGLGQLMHAMRRNTGVTCIVHENGMAAGGAPAHGPAPYPVQPLAIALAAGGSYIAQAKPGDALPGLLREAVQHEGFALLNVVDRMVAEGPVNLDEDEAYDRHAREQAMHRAFQVGPAYVGVLYHEPERQAFEELVLNQAPVVSFVWTVEDDPWYWFEEMGEGGGNT